MRHCARQRSRRGRVVHGPGGLPGATPADPQRFRDAAHGDRGRGRPGPTAYVRVCAMNGIPVWGAAFRTAGTALGGGAVIRIPSEDWSQSKNEVFFL